jgi:ribosome biogenesis GTPase A
MQQDLVTNEPLANVFVVWKKKDLYNEKKQTRWRQTLEVDIFL